jgi:citronellol/citronellal dehydrogenase
MAMNRTLAGKTIFISGGSRGIGLAIALRAARDGANIAIAAKTSEPHPSLPGTISTAARQIEEAGGRALPLVCDIREEEQVEAAVAAIVARFGGIDICLNNASAVRLRTILDMPMKRYDLINGVNARGTFLVTQKCLPHLYDGRESACPCDFATAQHGGTLVRTARCLFDLEVRHESRDARRSR